MEKETIKLLIEEALLAREKAYTPYSHYRVGAALLSAGNVIYRGCNIENSSFGATNCAERTALFKAVSEGEREFLAIAVIGGPENGKISSYAYPCGICRQALSEFCKTDMPVICALSTDEYEIRTLGELLVCSFSAASMEEA